LSPHLSLHPSPLPSLPTRRSSDLLLLVVLVELVLQDHVQHVVGTAEECLRVGDVVERAPRAPLPGKRPQAVRLARAGLAEPEDRSEEHTSELQSRVDLVCRLLLEK